MKAIVMVLLAGASLCAQADVGQKVQEFEFGDFLMHGDGRTKLSEFRGSPILIDFWGTRCPPCVGSAVPHAIKLEQEFGAKGLVVVLMECQGSPDVDSFMMKRFPDNQCRVIAQTGMPIRDTGGGKIPRCALIGVDGTLLEEGLYSKVSGNIDKLVAAEVKKRAAGWGETKEIRKARSLMYGADDLSGARTLLDGLQVAGDAAADLEAARQELASLVDRRKRTVAWLMDQGRFVDAREAAKDLEKSVAANAEWASSAKELTARFETPEAKEQLALDKSVGNVLRGMEAKGPKGGEAQALRKLVKGKESTKVGVRAERIAAALAKLDEK